MGTCRGSLHLSAVAIDPQSAILNAGDMLQFTAQGVNCDGTAATVAVTWAAEGGTIDSGGNYTAGTVGGSYIVSATTTAAGPKFKADVPVQIVAAPATVLSVDVTPDPAVVVVGRQKQMTAVVNMSDGTTAAFTGTWATTSGSITSAGLLTVGSSPGNYVVTATQDAIDGTAVLTVTAAPTLASIVVSPSTTVTLTTAQTQQYTAKGILSDGTQTTVSVVWSKTGSSNTISTNGLFTAGSTPGTYTVTATQTGGSIFGTSSVTVQTSNPAAPTARIAAPLDGFSYVSGTTHPLDPTGSTSQGTGNPWNAHWVVKDGAGVTKLDVTGTSGTIAGNTFPFTPGAAGTRTIYLTVIDSFGTTSPTVTVSGTVTATAPTLSSVTVSPNPVTLQPSQTQQFTATGHYTDGSAKVIPVTWTATGGNVTTGGFYTAGPTAGTFSITATSV